MAKPATATGRSASIDAQKGVWVERGYFTLTPAITGVISANSELECDVDQALGVNSQSAQLSDAVFVNAHNLTAGLVPKSCRVTAVGVVSVTLANVTGSNITDSTQNTFDYVLYHYSSNF